METMYARIKKLRNELGWSQEELAKKVGYADKTSIAKIEAGKVDLPQSKIIAFSKALKTTTSYLMDGDIDERPHTFAAHFDGTEFSEEQLDRIREFAKFIKQEKK